MNESQPRRRLVAIMFTDMVGYSALMQRNEALGLQLVKAQRELFRPLFAMHGGNEIKNTGDGFLVEFPSALDAMRCAISLQQALHDRNADVPAPEVIQVRGWSKWKYWAAHI